MSGVLSVEEVDSSWGGLGGWSSLPNWQLALGGY